MTLGLVCLLAWSAGIALAGVSSVLRLELGVLALCLGAASAALGSAVRPAIYGLGLAFLLLGIGRVELAPGPAALDPTQVARLAGQQVTVRGSVTDDPKPQAQGYEAVVQPLAATGSGALTGLHSRLLAQVRSQVEPAPGDEVEVSGRLALPRDRPGFDRRTELALKGIQFELRPAQLRVLKAAGGIRAAPLWLRERYRAAIAELLPAPHAQVLVGVVLGVRSGIPAQLQQDLIATGLVHLLVLSGLKVAIFARLARAALFPLLGRLAVVPVLVLIALYALAGGATPAALRATGMGALALVAAQVGRPTYVWTSLAAAAAAMLGWQPELIWDVGFQLSFAGTAAIILLTPGLEARLRWLPGVLREPFAVTAAAQIGTAPFMASGFHLLSPVAPVANALVLPLLPALVAAGLLITPLSAFPPIGQLAAVPLAALLAYVDQVAGLLARVPAAAVPVPAISLLGGVAYYVALGAALVAQRSGGRTRRGALVAGVVLPLLVAGGEVVQWSRPDTSATVLAVGQGQAVLLSGSGGRVLIDGGSSPTRLAAQLGARLPPWIGALDGLIITGTGAAHVGGLAGFDRSVATVVLPAGAKGGTAWRGVALTQLARGAKVLQVQAGQRVNLAGFQIDILSPEVGGDAVQLGLRVSAGHGSTFCDMADLDTDSQQAAAARLARLGGCTELLLPDAGRSAPAPELLMAARASRLLVSDGGGQLARDLPHSGVYRTSEEGDIAVSL
ncbi:MAG: ComEC/Rec2 family competence protein [Candidatus Dormibacter sp.]|uniref:ComEC/Rec2 family competence protein n=1 Tax=Candidatus Dormibacter sp. TaxID=2973982 RepID=UPI000DB37B36|nr:MAG: hypothetical protein DLM66_00550 [Candidatus Dormibacteraeota bacterium]